MAPSAPSRVVAVEIQGQRYPVRSDLDANYVADLAAYVDSKMRLAARESSAADSMRVAVIAALNIADELFRARDEAAGGHDAIFNRAAELERIVDAVLARDVKGTGVDYAFESDERLLGDERPTGTNA